MAGSLEGVIAGIPGLGGYAASQQFSQQQQMGQLAQLAQMQQLMNGPLRTKLLEAQIAEHEQAPDLKRAQIENTKQIALNNLQQKVSTELRHAYEFAQTLPIKQRELALKEIGAQAQTMLNAGRMQIQAGIYQDATGANITGLTDLASKIKSLYQPPAIEGPQVTAPQVPPEQVIRGTAPTETAGMAQFGSGPPGQPRTVEVAPPTAAPVAPPVAAPVAPQPMPAPPNNMDARDLRLAAGGNAPTPATSVTAQAPAIAKIPTLADAPVGLAPKEARKWLADQTKASIAGAGRLTPEALKLVAEQYLAGDPRAASGYARDQNTKAALTNEIAKQALAAGMDGRMVAATMAEFEGFRSGQRVLGTREAQLAIAADVTSKFVPIAVEASEKVDRTEFKSLNDVIQAAQRATASPELRRFAAANNALINVYARAINPQGVATVSDKDHAREILSTAFSKGDYKAGAEQLKVEVDTELKSPGSVKKTMRQSFTGTENPDTQPAAKTRLRFDAQGNLIQ